MNEILTIDILKEKIYEIRKKKGMFNFDLAKIFGYELKRFNEQIKRNESNFIKDTYFKISKEELKSIVQSQNATSNCRKSR